MTQKPKEKSFKKSIVHKREYNEEVIGHKESFAQIVDGEEKNDRMAHTIQYSITSPLTW